MFLKFHPEQSGTIIHNWDSGTEDASKTVKWLTEVAVRSTKQQLSVIEGELGRFGAKHPKKLGKKQKTVSVFSGFYQMA